MSEKDNRSGPKGRQRHVYWTDESGVLHRELVTYPESATLPPAPEEHRCPTCRSFFGSVDMVEKHLRLNPNHRPDYRAPARFSTKSARRPDFRRSIPDVNSIRFSRYLRMGINQFLEDVYGKQQLLSDMLLQEGLSTDKILQLRMGHLPTYLPRVVQAWCADWHRFFGPPGIWVVVRHYGLDGRPPSATEVSHELRITSWEVAHIRQALLNQLGRSGRLERLGAIAVWEANRLLG
jgi:hypothetical protein